MPIIRRRRWRSGISTTASGIWERANRPAWRATRRSTRASPWCAKATWCCVPDALCFEERQNAQLQNGDFERFEFLRYVVAGKCMAWKNILDMRRAIDYVCSRAEVQPQRIGCYGHSMGSTHTWLVGPWEPRLQCLVGNCCLPTYKAIHRHHLLHCFPNFIPGLFAYGDTPDIAALIAPRPLHLNFGETDSGSPIEEVRAGVERIAAAYARQNAAEHFSHFIEPNTGHVLSENDVGRKSATGSRDS